jgi:hypothetical protein
MDPKTASMLWNHKVPAAVSKPVDLLFEFVRAPDASPIRCELRFNGESYGWEARFFDGRELWYSRGAFALKEFAIQWAWEERKAMEG